MAAYLVGGIPSSGNFRLQDLLGYLPSRFEGIISGSAGFMFGLALTREQIVLRGFETISATSSAIGICVGLYLVMESVIRLGITLKSIEPLPALPVWILYWVTDRVVELLDHNEAGT